MSSNQLGFCFFPFPFSHLEHELILNLITLEAVKWMPIAIEAMCLCYHPPGERGKALFSQAWNLNPFWLYSQVTSVSLVMGEMLCVYWLRWIEIYLWNRDGVNFPHISQWRILTLERKYGCVRKEEVEEWGQSLLHSTVINGVLCFWINDYHSPDRACWNRPASSQPLINYSFNTNNTKMITSYLLTW